MKSRKSLSFHLKSMRVSRESPLAQLRMPGSRAQSRLGLRVTALEAFAPADVSVGAEVEIKFPWPEFPPEIGTRDRLEWLLSTAAAIEHALLVQYLYAGYSLKAEGRPVVLGIAIEEMSHLLTVQNLLMSIGSPPALDRQDFGQLFPFSLHLQPFSATSLAKFVIAESPSNPVFELQEDRDLFDVIREQAEMGSGDMIHPVGAIYALMSVFFGTERVLADKAEESPPNDLWYPMVRDLAGMAAQHYGGREFVHLPDDFEFVSDPRQGIDDTWDRTRKGAFDEFRVHTVGDRDSALFALKDIAQQGEGPTASMDEEPHFVRFFQLYKTFYGPGGAPPEVWPVPSGMKISVGETNTGEDGISSPTTIPWAQLADYRYWLLLGILEQHLVSASEEDRQFLAAWCFTEMYHLKKLGEFLTNKPRHSMTGSGEMAAIPFNMPPELPSENTPVNNSTTHQVWSPVFEQWFAKSIAIAEALAESATDPQEQQFLDYMIRVDRRKQMEAAARQRGQSVRSRFDQVREVLEWASGTGDPYLDHEQLGRFWNLDLGQLKAKKLEGEPILGFAGQSQLVDVLESNRMPGGGRPKLNVEKHRHHIRFIKDWIEDGAPGHAPRNAREIKEIRILPPMAIARLGSSPEPMDNYDLKLPDDAGTREILPAETFILDPNSGEILRAVTPATVRFRDGMNRVRPVSPFLEVWARFDDGPFEPLDEPALRAAGLTPSDIRWDVRVGNLKMLRRTGVNNDAITASISAEALSTHQQQRLIGRCNHFKPNRTITLGWVQYVKPTSEFPEIRLRFTPGSGYVYGHTEDDNIIPEERAVYDPVSGDWDMHSDNNTPSNPEVPRAAESTVPGGIYARSQPPQSVNLGYFDDSCDGIVRASLTVNGEEKTALARITSGPPDFAPQHLPVRSVQDDLEQMILGTEVLTVEPEQVIDLVRRAVETVRLLSTENENDSFPFWVPAARQMFGAGGARYLPTRDIHTGLLRAVTGLKSADPNERQAAVGALKQIQGILRPARETWNYSRQSAPGDRPPLQYMPALMRGGDGGLLALTQRQLNIIKTAIDQFDNAGGDATPLAAMKRLIQNHQFAAALHSSVDLPAGGTLADLFADSETLISYLSDPSTVARGRTSDELGFKDQRLIIPQEPANSALLTMVKRPDHPMNGPLTSYQDSVLGINGIEVIERWIDDMTA
ncbi:MAG: hypothetical protein MI923_06500 [Phycisphaerales bacterium]|nr:hypothetical protein [Phycisphaerales bacterium]